MYISTFNQTWTSPTEHTPNAGADPEIFQRGVGEENFERKMFVDTRINTVQPP